MEGRPFRIPPVRTPLTAGRLATKCPSPGTESIPMLLTDVTYHLPHDEQVDAYLDHLRARGRQTTAITTAQVLATYARLLHRERSGTTPTTATSADLIAYRTTLATPAASLVGRTMALATQATHLAVVRSFHRWLRDRHLSVLDAAPFLPLPRIDQRTVQKEYLSQQEAQALLAMAQRMAVQYPVGSLRYAGGLRDAAAIAIALATGRRRTGLCALAVTDVDLDRGELRVAWEKGCSGRVLPLARWAVRLVAEYLAAGRPVLLRGQRCLALFLGSEQGPFTAVAFDHRLDAIMAETRAANPDLTDLSGKRISSHSLRVTCARLLFSRGCPIRTVNEILLHTKLSTTAAYTPIPVREQRRALLASHPRV